MAVQQVIIQTKPHRPVNFSTSAVQAVVDESYIIADVKYDGVRLNLCVWPGLGEASLHWLSREGKQFPALSFNGAEPLDRDDRWAKFFGPDEALFKDGFMLDAELLIDDLPCKDIAGTLRRHEAIELGRFKVMVFGIVPMDVVLSGQEYRVTHSVMKYHVAYQVGLLKKRFPEIDWQVAESWDLFSMEEIDQTYEVVREQNMEGLVLKDPNGFYKRSKQVGMWKCVPDDNEDGTIVGLVWGTEGKANEGKVIGFEVLLESGHVVNACKITKAQMEEFTDAFHNANCYHCCEDCNGPKVNPYEGYTARVTFMERHPDGSLRHPSFDSFRGISDPKIKE
ncbi:MULTISPECIES: hypothetical protein [unclassified Pseudomonas]|uniref:ATP-dependent DNA ligase n=1 Tax=unclassified Pseudomonas TaxID=196821 RepID=UPI000C87E021|nr:MULTISPECIES: hypothetical protein [unclassified Pseudomonas]DAF68319.1 MAG TPA: ATP-dependent DNA ligase [Caudoviricetes sp.]PMX08440.1 hypothetical protein C1Y25_24000 [Pseudomonas sp. MPBC4-3]PMX44692.1 hypothetical protein C1Y20_24300 [Pseudomonas sp. FW301-21B01]PMY02221.1 hypothetical protein C1Y18_31270 [Pseudomonas sp. MPR-R5A]PNA65231.1 hypothetical protein C1Y14_24420 [Pseudomonas sp. MPR-R5B]